MDNSANESAPVPLDDVTASAESLSPEQGRRLRHAQLSSILAHVSTATLISTAFAVLLTFYFAPFFGVTAVKTWLVLKVLSAAPRFIFANAYNRSKSRKWISLESAERFTFYSLAADGAVWGLAGVWAVRNGAEPAALGVAAMLCSVALLSTFGLQVRRRGVAFYVIPMLGPMSLAAFSRFDTFGMFLGLSSLLTVVQSMLTGLASERRVAREFIARENATIALRDRSHALKLASASASELEKALREVKRQSAAKAVFLGTMSHELRTPLHGILGMTELVQREVSDISVKHRLRLIESSGTHLLELISALLDVSRIDSGHLQLHPAPFDLIDEVQSLAELYEARAQAKAIGFRFSIALGERCWVRADSARIRQIIHNLLGNAIKFTQRGLVQFTVKSVGPSFVFEVTDTGPGIADEDLPRIFEAFHQTDSSASRPAEGTGLGLTIARELAHAMDGEIVVKSALGVGTRFAFAVKLPAIDPSEIPAPGKSAVDRISVKRGYRVLLVEDNEVNAMIATAHLENLGLRPMRVSDGKQAIEAAFGRDRPDLILMDCRMPVMDGTTATREIRMIEKAGGLNRVPIVALTAAPSDDDKRECFEAGMDGFLMKPFTDQQLMRAIREYIEDVAIAKMGQEPLYEFAKSLDDMEPDLFSGVALH